MKKIDINCDMGESFGNYRLDQETLILPYVTSANIACGFHAGDPGVMRESVRRCLEQGIRIGAHPGLPDLQGFGRRFMAISPREAYDLTVYQVGALAGFAVSEGGRLQHIKPHGALYHMANADAALAEAIVEAAYKIDPELILFAPPEGALLAAAGKIGLSCAREAFADRAYGADGKLLPRTAPNAVLEDEEAAADQALRLAEAADTLCVHGDHPHAAGMARAVRTRLEAAGFAVGAFR